VSRPCSTCVPPRRSAPHAAARSTWGWEEPPPAAPRDVSTPASARRRGSVSSVFAPSLPSRSLIPTVTGSTVRSFCTHGQQSAAQGSSTTVSRSDTRLIQHLDFSAHGLVRRWRLIGYFPILYYPRFQLECLQCVVHLSHRSQASAQHTHSLSLSLSHAGSHLLQQWRVCVAQAPHVPLRERRRRLRHLCQCDVWCQYTVCCSSSSWTIKGVVVLLDSALVGEALYDGSNASSCLVNILSERTHLLQELEVV
jgi:hypothetical protein